MKLRVVGCSHHNTPIEIREPMAFDQRQVRDALDAWREKYETTEAVVVSTCNRVEFYMAAEQGEVPCKNAVAVFLADFHSICPEQTCTHLFDLVDREAIIHLYRVASSLDSMVVGESQVLAQVRQSYEAAVERQTVGTLLHEAFQGAVYTARRIDSETDIHRHRVSVPSVAVADFAKQIFQRFDDKQVLVIGAGEMAEETLRYLRDEGARRLTVMNRNRERADQLARQWGGETLAWDKLDEGLEAADLIVSATGSSKPIVSLERFFGVEKSREHRPLFILDLAVPRDFEPTIGDRADVYLYCVDDLQAACEQNLAARKKALPAAERIVQQEVDRYFTAAHQRTTGPVIESLKRGWQEPKDAELERLFKRLPQLDDSARNEIDQAFDRLLNKLLHRPMVSLRREARQGFPSALVDALAKLFHLKD